MTESHQFDFPRFDFFNEGRDVFCAANGLEHSQNGFVCSSMPWSVKRTNGGGDGGVDINPAGGQVPHCARGAIQLVVSVKDEQNVQRFR